MNSQLAAVLTEQGIDPKSILYEMRGDTAADGSICDVYLCLSPDSLYLLSGIELVAKTRGKRRLQCSFQLKELQRIPLKDVESLRVERLLSSSRLIAEGSEPRLLAVFSLGLTQDLEDFSKAFEAVKEGRPVPPSRQQDSFCPKCGNRYPEQGRKVCPRCMSKMGVTRRLMGFFDNYRKRFFAIIAVMFLSTAFSILSPYIGTKLLFDDVLTQGGRYFGMVLATVLVIAAVRLGTVLFNMLHTYVLSSIIPWIVYDIKVKIFASMQKLSLGYYTSKQTGALMTRVNRDSNNIYWFFVDGFPYVIVNGITFAGVAVMMLMMSWKLALITIAVIPTVIVIFKLMWKTFQGMHHKIWVYDSSMSSLVSDTLNGQRVIKAFAKEEEEVGRFDVHSRSLADSEVRLSNTESTAFPLVYLLMFLAQVVVTAVGGVMVLRGEISLGTLLTFIAYLSMLYGPLEFMSWVSNWWSRCVDSCQRVFEIIDARSDVEELEHPLPKETVEGDIRFDHVTFAYEPARPVIRDLCLHIRAGEMLGIVGKAGAGKSTIANLIARLYDPTQGRVLIDGEDVRNLSSALIRRSIGVVSQEIYLFIGSIADNIRYAKPDASIEEVVAAAKAAGAHDFIMRLPDAYETRVGAGGQDLSGGERQRLSIARTIIQNPRILILDEATAAMDTETERKIQQSINALRGGRTTIAIAHRLSTLKDADCLAVISEGQVVEYGAHSDLIREKGEYFKLYSIQMQALKNTTIG